MTDHATPIRPGLPISDPTPLPPLPAISTASSLLKQAHYLAGLEVSDLLKSADALQDCLNTVIRTGLAPVGVIEAAVRFRRGLIEFSNNVQSLSERASK